jgi:hypothetical protein
MHEPRSERRVGAREAIEEALGDYDDSEGHLGRALAALDEVKIELAPGLTVEAHLSDDDGALVVQIDTPAEGEHGDQHDRARVYMNEAKVGRWVAGHVVEKRADPNRVLWELVPLLEATNTAPGMTVLAIVDDERVDQLDPALRQKFQFEIDLRKAP